MKIERAKDVVLLLGFLLVISIGFWVVISPSKEVILGIAASKGDTNKVSSLIERGIDVNWQNRQGITAMMLAAKHGQERTLRVLLDAGADPSAKDHKGRTAEDYAIASGWTNLTLILSKPVKSLNINSN